jgi:hypothetical protein
MHYCRSIGNNLLCEIINLLQTDLTAMIRFSHRNYARKKNCRVSCNNYMQKRERHQNPEPTTAIGKLAKIRRLDSDQMCIAVCDQWTTDLHVSRPKMVVPKMRITSLARHNYKVLVLRNLLRNKSNSEVFWRCKGIFQDEQTLYFSTHPNLKCQSN